MNPATPSATRRLHGECTDPNCYLCMLHGLRQAGGVAESATEPHPPAVPQAGNDPDDAGVFAQGGATPESEYGISPVIRGGEGRSAASLLSPAGMGVTALSVGVVAVATVVLVLLIEALFSA